MILFRDEWRSRYRRNSVDYTLVENTLNTTNREIDIIDIELINAAYQNVRFMGIIGSLSKVSRPML